MRDEDGEYENDDDCWTGVLSRGEELSNSDKDSVENGKRRGGCRQEWKFNTDVWCFQGGNTMSGMLRFDIFMKMKMDICEKFGLKPPNKDMSSAELNFPDILNVHCQRKSKN